MPSIKESNMLAVNKNKTFREIGLKCSACGIYFEEKHNKPVLCEYCYCTPKYRKQYPKAILAIHKIRE